MRAAVLLLGAMFAAAAVPAARTDETFEARARAAIVEAVESRIGRTGALVETISVTATPVETLEEKLSDLLALAGESHALLQRAAQVRADVEAVAKARREAADMDDEEAVLWMT